MCRLSKKLLVALVLFAALAKLSEARAKADIWEEEDDDDDWWGKSEEEKKDEPAAPRSNAAPAVASVAAAPSDPHANHPASHHTHNNPTDVRQNWDTNQGGFQGGNFASHNESCNPTTKHCIRNANMECSATDGTGRCACIGGWVYVRSTESCWKIPMSSQDECAHDVQCQAGSWGHLSKCNKQTARCACHDWSGYGRETIRTEDGICFIKKKVGDLCRTHEECDHPIPGDAYCQYGQHDSAGGQQYNGSCQCRDTHHWYNPSGKCLAKAAKLGDPCEVSDQCREGSLGKLSTCERESATCRCVDLGGVSNKTEIIYYERLKKCFFKKEYNDTCKEHDECRANLGPDVECGTTEEYPDVPEGFVGVCHCPKGKVCRSSGFSMVTVGGNAFSTASLACASIVIGMTIKMKGFLTTTSG